MMGKRDLLKNVRPTYINVLPNGVEAGGGGVYKEVHIGDKILLSIMCFLFRP